MTARRTTGSTPTRPQCAPRNRLVAAIVTALLCAAPVPGDIGACAQPVQALDAPRFFQAHKTVDCRRCTECGFHTKTCARQCGREPPSVTAFPADCLPLVHDGEVCLRALLEASCSDYEAYVADDAPTVPTECDFCPEPPP